MSPAAIEQWDRYWAYGSLHSFSQVAGGNYQGAIAAFWRGRFGTLATGSRVVDIATGNGALPLLALEAAAAAGIEIEVDGVDLADIDPLHRVQDPALRQALRRVRFWPRTPAEALPFDAAGVDLVCSQYGLEYSDLERSVAEVGRVCAAGGRLALVLHHADSLPLQATAGEIARLDYVLEEARLWLHARNLLQALAQQGRMAGGRDSPKVAKKRRALERSLQSIRRRADGDPAPRMLLGPTQYIHEILAHVGRAPHARLLELLEETRQRVLANRRRLADMQQAALDAAGLGRLEGLLRANAFDGIECGPLQESDGGLLGWRLTARRRPGPGAAD